MPVTLKRTLRVLAVLAALAVASLVVNSYFGSGDQVCADPGGCKHTCEHQVCNTYCWADGYYTDRTSCTYARHTPFAPNDCPPGGGCVTAACN